MTRSCSKIAVGCAVSLHLAFAAALAARADGTIDFEASVPDTLFQQGYCGDCGVLGPYHEDGFVIAEISPGWILGQNPAHDAIGNSGDGGSKHMVALAGYLASNPAGTPTSGIRFERENQEYFSVHSLRLSEYSQVFPFPAAVRLVGVREDGLVERLFTTDGIVDGTGGLPDFEFVELDPDFSNLLRFEIVGLTGQLDLQRGGFAVDDVVYSVVPEPGTAALLVLGLLGFAVRRKIPHWRC